MKLILESLESCLEILQDPTGEVENYQAEIKKAQAALSDACALAKHETADVILGGLYAMGYEADHILFRVTAEDFADLLANYMAERGASPFDLMPDELESLLSSACDYLNGEGMSWADVVEIALDDAWPERLKGSDA